MKERASFTNAVVSTAPAPIRNPRRDCSIKNPPRCHAHLEGLATYCCPCGPHRRATVAGLRLVGGTVRSSQDASAVFITMSSLFKSGHSSVPRQVSFGPAADIRRKLERSRGMFDGV